MSLNRIIVGMACSVLGIAAVTGLPPLSPASANAGTFAASAEKGELLASILVRAKEGRGDNFKLDVAEGEQIYFEVDSEDVRKANPSFWMNRDKRGKFGAEDKRIYSDLHHGDVRTVQNFSRDSGVRMYVKSKYSKDFYLNIYRAK